MNEFPAGKEWGYEPKWDGFRCLAFRDGKEVELQSKSGQSLTRYFPEIVAAVLGIKAKRLVLDGELVIPVKGGLSFDDLLQRIHPAASRLQNLSRETPARYVVFDFLFSMITSPAAGFATGRGSYAGVQTKSQDSVASIKLPRVDLPQLLPGKDYPGPCMPEIAIVRP